MELDDLTIVYKDVADLIPYARNPRKNDQAIDRLPIRSILIKMI